MDVGERIGNLSTHIPAGSSDKVINECTLVLRSKNTYDIFSDRRPVLFNDNRGWAKGLGLGFQNSKNCDAWRAFSSVA